MYNDIYQSCIKVVLKLYVSKLYQSFVTVLSKLNIKVALKVCQSQWAANKCQRYEYEDLTGQFWGATEPF